MGKRDRGGRGAGRPAAPVAGRAPQPDWMLAQPRPVPAPAAAEPLPPARQAVSAEPLPPADDVAVISPSPSGAEPAVPPKLLRYEAIYRDLRARGVDPDDRGASPSAIGLAPQRAGLPGRVPDSMPVLQAFQDFLEIERTRTRNRLLSLGMLFLILLLGVAGAAGLFGYLFYRQSREDLASVQVSVASGRAAQQAAAAEILAALLTASQHTARVSAQMRRDGSAIEDLRTALSTRDGTYADTLDRVQDSMSMLQLENTSLRRSLEDTLARLQRNASGAPPSAPPAQPAPPADGPRRTRTLEVPVARADGATNVRLRLIIPE